MADGTTYQPDVDEEQMDDPLNNLTNTITSYATNLANLSIENDKLAEQLNLSLAQNKILTDLLSRKICGISST